MRKPLFVTAVIVLAVFLMSLGLFAVACGGSSTTTTAGVTTTAAVTTTAGVTTTAAAVTTTAGVTTTAAAVTTTAAATIDAAALYATNCSGCHKNVPGASADQATSVIKSGKESMPGFTDKLSAAQITALANYVGNGGK